MSGGGSWVSGLHDLDLSYTAVTGSLKGLKALTVLSALNVSGLHEVCVCVVCSV